MTWILSIYIACNGWGCGIHHHYSFPDSASCYEALEHVKQGPELKSDHDGNQYSAYCAPDKEAK